MTRRTADSITDDELDALYAELARLRDAAGNASRNGLSSPLAASQGSGDYQGAGGRDGSSGGRVAAPDRAELRRLFQAALTRQWAEVARYVMDDVLHDVIDCHLDLVGRATAELRAQLADAWKYARQIEETLTAVYQSSNEAEAARAAAEERAHELEHAAREADRLRRDWTTMRDRAEQAETEQAELRADCRHHSDDADQWSDRATAAEAALARGLALCADADRRGITSGPPLTTDRIRAALTPQADDTTVGTAVLTVTVTAPTQENAGQWAATIRDLIAAEHGDEMRLHMTISPTNTTEETR